MKYWRFIIIGLAFALLIYYYFAVYKDARQHDTQMQTTQQASQKQWESKTDEQAQITVKVIPLQLGTEQNQWEFEVTFTTHTGDLNIDPAKISVLTDDQGNSYQPMSWEGPGPGGHHISGTLTFNTIANTKSVELKVKDVGGIPERSFEWNLE